MAVTPLTEYQLRKVSRVRRDAATGRARAIREAAGISLREAAKAVRTTPASISRWETGKHSPGPEAALRYGALLDALAEAAA